MTFFNKKGTDFLVKIIKKSLRIREESGFTRLDMIQLMLNTRKGQECVEDSKVVDTGFCTAQEIHNKTSEKYLKFTDDQIIANCIGVFFAGFDSFSSSISFLAHELAVNPDIQDRLRAEIDDTLSECNGQLTYEALMKMKYMDMIISGELFQYAIFN